MTDYIATFWTHLAATCTLKALLSAGVAAEATPVPRKLSASCGTCVRYRADAPMAGCLHRDYERVYIVLSENSYKAVLANDAAV